MNMMESKVQYKKQAIFLRQQGKTYGEILKEIPVSRATLSYWLRTVPVDPLTALGRSQRVEEKRSRARILAKIGRRVRQAEREKGVRGEAQSEWEQWKNTPFFIFGLGIYRARGNKKGSTAGISTGDPDLAELMQKWFVQYLGAAHDSLGYRIYCHSESDCASLAQFWADKLEITAENIVVSLLNGHWRGTPSAENKGIMQITIPGTKAMKILQFWQIQANGYY